MISKKELHLRNLATRHRYKILKLGHNVYLLGNENGISISNPGTAEEIEICIDTLLLIDLERLLRNVNAPVIREGSMFKIPNGSLLSAKDIKKWWNRQCQTASLRI